MGLKDRIKHIERLLSQLNKIDYAGLWRHHEASKGAWWPETEAEREHIQAMRYGFIIMNNSGGSFSVESLAFLPTAQELTDVRDCCLSRNKPDELIDEIYSRHLPVTLKMKFEYWHYVYDAAIQKLMETETCSQKNN